MALRGTVSDYGLADVLQLIAIGGRSGHLCIERGSDTLNLMIRAGVVVDVRGGLAPDAALGSRLVQAELLTDELLGWALVERAKTGRSVAELLTEAEHVHPDDLRQQANLHRWDTILAPFTWDSGRYAFKDGEVVDEDPWTDPVPVDQLLMRGLRLVEEWSGAVEQVPSRRWVVARRVPLPAPTSSDLDPFLAGFEPGPEPDPTISEEARAVHVLAAPGIRVGWVMSRSPYDRYETTLALAELTHGHFLVLTPP